MESVEEVPEPTVTLPPPVAAEQPAAVAPVAASVPFPSASPAPPPVATPMPNQTVAALSPHSSSAARKRKSSGSPVSSLHTEKPLPSSRAHENENVPTPKTSAGTQASQSTNVDSVPSATSRHRPTMSSDRFSIRSLLNGHAGPSDRAGRNPARVEATGTVAPPAVPSSDGPLDDVSNRRRSTRRQKALSLQPFRSSVNSKLPKQARANVEAAIAASRDRPSIDTAEAAAPTQPPPTSSDKRFNTDLEANWQQQASPVNPTPSGKAKAVMDWFRRRSTRQDTSALAPPSAADFQRRERPLSSVYESATSTASTRSRMSTPVIVAPKERPQQATAVNESTPPLTPAQTASNSSANAPSAARVQSSQVVRQDVPPISTRASSQPAAPAASAFSPAKLRFHQGALDKNAVTYRSPDEVFAEIKQVLWNMGVEMVLEGDYSKSPLATTANAFSTPSGADLYHRLCRDQMHPQEPQKGVGCVGQPRQLCFDGLACQSPRLGRFDALALAVALDGLPLVIRQEARSVAAQHALVEHGVGLLDPDDSWLPGRPGPNRPSLVADDDIGLAVQHALAVFAAADARLRQRQVRRCRRRGPVRRRADACQEPRPSVLR